MGRPRKNYTCRECGVPCDRRGRTKGGVSCIYCAIERYERSNREIHERRGEYYEKWIAGMETATAQIRREYEARAASAGAEQDG